MESHPSFRTHRPRVAPLALACLMLTGCGTAVAAMNDSPSGTPMAAVDRQALAESCATRDGATITAEAGAFDTDCLSASADELFTIRMWNRDRHSDHNLSIFDGATPVFTGELVPPEGAITYRSPALAAGSYTFRCTIDPSMTGDFIVA